jgi:hypothetical protein
MDSFCCLFYKTDESTTSDESKTIDAGVIVKERHTNTVTLKIGVTCYHQGVFSDVVIVEDNPQIQVAIKYYEGKIWCSVIHFAHHLFGQSHFSLYTMIPEGPNIQVETVVRGQGFDTGDHFGKDPSHLVVLNRLKGQLWEAMAYVFALGSLVTGIWLVLARGEPVGIAMLPITWVVSSLAITDSLVTSAVGLIIPLAGLAIASLVRNISETTREIILWVTYASLASEFVLEVYLGIDGDEGGNPGFMILVWALTAITLNHPALELAGVASGVATLVFVVLLLTGIVEDSTDAWLAIPLCVLISVGLGALGYQIRLHRSFLLYYGRRSWQAMVRHLWPASTLTSEATPMVWGVAREP